MAAGISGLHFSIFDIPQHFHLRVNDVLTERLRRFFLFRWLPFGLSRKTGGSRQVPARPGFGGAHQWRIRGIFVYATENPQAGLSGNAAETSRNFQRAGAG
ncbi:MAG: hypothetical protein HY242_07900 [Afipia sp.]|nr:hypothetical protein [Afipia sp.]